MATKAHNIEMTIASHRAKSSSSYDSRKHKGELKKDPKSLNKDSMFVSITEPVWISGKAKYENKKGGFFKDTGNKCPTLKEL